VFLEGNINQNLKPQMDIEVRGAGGIRIFRALVDSGFSECLILPLLEIQRLNLPKLRGRISVRTAAGIVLAETYEGRIVWRGYERAISIIALGDEPILGLRLFSGYVLTMEVWSGGRLAILPAGESVQK
jgi:predicted aspartyl protease